MARRTDVDLRPPNLQNRIREADSRGVEIGPTLTAVPDARPPRGLRVDAWRWTLGVCAVLIAVYPFLPDLVQLALYHLIGLVAVGGIVAGVRLHRLPRPLPWLLLAAGQLAFTLGDGLWDLYDRVLGASPSPSPADILYLSGYPLLAAGLAMLGRRRSAAAGSADLIDAAIVTIGASVVSWVFLIAPYAGDASLHVAERAVAIAYPAGDLLLLAMSAKLFLAPGGRSRAHTTFGIGLLSVLVADVVYAALTLAGSAAIPERFLDTGWLLGYLLIAVAVLDPTIRSLSEPAQARDQLKPRRLWLLACASLLAPATIAVQSLTGGDAHPLLIAFTSAALFGLVVLRMAGLVRRVEEQANELARVARTDALTGAPNRRAWDEQLAVELARAARDGAPVSVALLDLDHFKAYNDLRGHPAGDRLLREAAAAWQGELRTMDVLARYGGEEFGLILPGCRPEAATGIVDRLRALTPEGETTSAGVAGWNGTETADALVARTDRALYAAKRSGRDRTVLATPVAGVVRAA
jgi:diguanylate cyclase (GGDEF)-like protein